MDPETIGRIEQYIQDMFVQQDDVLRSFPEELKAAGMPEIQVPAELGQLLSILVRATGARKILEIGTLGGYSATWMARAMPEGGRLITLEKEPKHAAFARNFLAKAGVADRVEVIEGAALDTLPTLLSETEPRFDMVFIDADKENYPAYLDWAMRLLRVRGLIVADNVLRHGEILNPSDPAAEAMAVFNEHVAKSPLLAGTIIPNRGYADGIVLAVLEDELPHG